MMMDDHQPDILANAKLADGTLVDIVIEGGRIAAIGPDVDAGGRNRIDLAGALVTPSLVDGHIHLDKTFLGLPFISHRKGTGVSDRIAHEKQIRRHLDLSVSERGAELIRQIVPTGTGAVRSHVDIDLDVGLSQLEQVLSLRQSFSHLIDIQIVAFPQSGILRSPGVADLLAEALIMGADLIGGLDPALIDDDIAGHLDAVFGLAERFGTGIDIHLHEPGQLGLFTLRSIAQRTSAAGLAGRVTVSHAFSLGEPIDIGSTLEALSSAGVAIATNAPGAATMPPVKRLHDAGVLVFAGSDNIRDAWSPYGNGDMLERAALVGYRQGLLADEDVALAFAMATDHAAMALGLPDYGLRVGSKADLMVLAASSIPEAVAARARRLRVYKSGREVARDGHLTGPQ